MKRIVLFVTALLITVPSYAWSNFFRFVNNFNVPMTLSIQPTLATVNSSCGNINNIPVAAYSQSCELEFTTAQPNWHTPMAGNSGTITIAKQADPTSYCTYRYDYSYTVLPYSYFDLHSEKMALQSCHGNLHPTEISAVNDHNEALPRPLTGSVVVNVDAEKAADATESLSQADCGEEGGDNCLIASPDLTTVYTADGSSLAESLVLQTELDRYEPLNFEQFIGSHNSAVSQHYTRSTAPLDLNHADPDHYLTVTDQLNSGVRQLELDIEWLGDAVTICHTDSSLDPNGKLCVGNDSMGSVVAEIKNWAQKHPSALLLIYLDVHKPLTGHVNDLDDVFAQLDPMIFTPAMAAQNYHSPSNTLPAFQFSQADLIQKYKTNIIIVNDNDTDNLKLSRYVFIAMQNSAAKPLTENGVDTYFASKYAACSDASKYSNMQKLYGDDPNRYNLLRLNAGRTVLNYVSSVGNLSPDQYVNYFTTKNLAGILSCPVNVFSTSMLGFTCGDDDCTSHPTDPKLMTFLWSWSLGYPLKSTGSTIAYINPSNGHFENDQLVQGNSYAVLCNHSTVQQTPIAPLQWYVENITLDDINNASQLAEAACQKTNGVFAVPTTSYWMSDVMTLLNISNVNSKVLVNYQHNQDEWVPNEVIPSSKGQQGLFGRSLVN